MALWREALYIVQEGIADPEDVDLAAKAGFGLRLPAYGMLEHADAVGLDMAKAVMQYAAPDLYNEPRPPAILQEKIDRGDLGAKAGRGFYDWSKRDFKAVVARRDQFVLDYLKNSLKPDRP
jgi:3-hydroxybutyryl-CoA dehydrogenase